MTELILGDAAEGTCLPTHGASLASTGTHQAKLYQTLRIGTGQRLEIRYGFIDHAEHIALTTTVEGELHHGLLLPKHALPLLSEGLADLADHLALDFTPGHGQGRLW